MKAPHPPQTQHTSHKGGRGACTRLSLQEASIMPPSSPSPSHPAPPKPNPPPQRAPPATHDPAPTPTPKTSSMCDARRPTRATDASSPWQVRRQQTSSRTLLYIPATDAVYLPIASPERRAVSWRRYGFEEKRGSAFRQRRTLLLLFLFLLRGGGRHGGGAEPPRLLMRHGATRAHASSIPVSSARGMDRPPPEWMPPIIPIPPTEPPPPPLPAPPTGPPKWTSVVFHAASSASLPPLPPNCLSRARRSSATVARCVSKRGFQR